MGCVYKITNGITQAVYVGSTQTTIENRYNRHLKDLRANKHHSIFLQRAWNKHGDVFEIKVLEFVENDKLLAREQFYLDDRKNNYPQNKNYNMCWVAGNCSGRKLSEETRRKISKAQIGCKKSVETKMRQSNSQALRIDKEYIFIDPNKNEYKTNNIRAFARFNHLCEACLWQLSKKKVRHHKGWTLKGLDRPTFGFISPNGLIYRNILHLKNFCKQQKLPYKGMSRLHRGNIKTCKGWSVT